VLVPAFALFSCTRGGCGGAQTLLTPGLRDHANQAFLATYLSRHLATRCYWQISSKMLKQKSVTLVGYPQVHSCDDNHGDVTRRLMREGRIVQSRRKGYGG
jgi:hypothetical protein